MAFPPMLIALEEHFMSPENVPHSKEAYTAFPPTVAVKLADLGEQRLEDMDEGGIGYQIISHAPIVANATQCRLANDELAAACEKHPDRFGAFAMLPMSDPEAAAAELRRCIASNDADGVGPFHGALINNSENGVFYDSPTYWPVFRAAAELDVPIYIHPSFPSSTQAEHFKGNYPSQVASMLGTASWSWHAETGHHFLRLFAAGLFDEIPNLKLILGHDGEMLPFMLDRIEPHAEGPGWGNMERKRGIRQVWRENVWVTTSAMFSLAPLACLLRVSPVEKVLYSVDYPFVSNENGLRFLQELKESGLVSEEEFRGISRDNATRLLKLDG